MIEGKDIFTFQITLEALNALELYDRNGDRLYMRFRPNPGGHWSTKQILFFDKDPGSNVFTNRFAEWDAKVLDLQQQLNATEACRQRAIEDYNSMLTQRNRLQQGNALLRGQVDRLLKKFRKIKKVIDK